MPRTSDAELRRENLAAAAARVIARAGMGGANLRDVAAEAGLTTGALTHYFSDKRELLLFTLSASLRGRARVIESDDPAEGLRRLLASGLLLTEEARLHWIVALAFCAQAAGDDGLAAVQRDAYRVYRRLAIRLLEQARADGRARPDIEPAEEADRLIALVDGIALQALLDPDPWPPERQRQLLDDALADLAHPASAGDGSGPHRRPSSPG